MRPARDVNGLRMNELYKPKQDAHITDSLELSGKPLILNLYFLGRNIFLVMNFFLTRELSFSLNEPFVLDGIDVAVRSNLNSFMAILNLKLS